MNIDMLRIAMNFIAISSFKENRLCAFTCTILLRRFPHPFQVANSGLVMCLPRKEEDQ